MLVYLSTHGRTLLSCYVVDTKNNKLIKKRGIVVTVIVYVYTRWYTSKSKERKRRVRVLL